MVTKIRRQARHRALQLQFQLLGDQGERVKPSPLFSSLVNTARPCLRKQANSGNAQKSNQPLTEQSIQYLKLIYEMLSPTQRSGSKCSEGSYAYSSS